MMREKEIVELDSKLANCSVNEGFSGGEKTGIRNLPMAMSIRNYQSLMKLDSD